MVSREARPRKPLGFFIMEQDYNKWKEYFKKHYQENKAKRKALVIKNREKKKDIWRKYEANWKRQRRKTNPDQKIKEAIRTRIYRAVKDGFKNKSNNSIDELGCSIKKYLIYLEQQFNEHMSWDNYGSYWEIDHIIPLSKGGSFHYTNTQPLTITENRQKGNQI